jgi:small subunit ribosomal protein S1
MSITDYGAFVELEPGIEGLIHVSEMSWTKKIKHPSKMLEVGQEVECQVLEVDARAKRISLGLKQLEPDPWTLFTDKYHPGDKIVGKVRSITDYGVFVGIEDGVDGMVHKTDLSWSLKVNNPADLYAKGDDVTAIILSINHDEKKVSLGVKQVYDDPWGIIPDKYRAGTVVDQVTVLRQADYGAFVKLEDGIEALIATSDLPEPTVNPGDTFKAEVQNIDLMDRRITMTARKVGEGSDGEPAEGGKRETRSVSRGGTLGDLLKEKLGDKLSSMTGGDDKSGSE